MRLPVAIALFAACSLAGPRVAFADSDPASSSSASAAAADPYRAFPLTVPHDKHYVRAGLEDGGILMIGLVDYLLNTTARGGTLRTGDSRWDLRYDWPLFRGKFTGSSYELDTNKFPTNYVSHPMAGTLYYSAARSNHLSIAESFLFAVVSSSLWEYFGEIRETNSINDMIVTPVAGLAIGETLMQFAGFFDHGRKQFGSDLLSFLFSPVKTVNEWTEGAEPLRTNDVDGLGLPRDRGHRFDIAARMGTTVQEATRPAAGPRSPRAAYADLGFSIDLTVANLPSYDRAGRHGKLFDDGNFARLGIDATFSGGQLVDGVFTTRIVPVGYWYRDAAQTERGVHGMGAMVGLLVGYEYGMHDWDRDRTRPTDLISKVNPLGILAEVSGQHGDLHLRTHLEISGGIAGVQSYGLHDYLATHVGDGLLTTLREQGYYHAYSVAVAPAVQVRWRALDAGAEFRLDTFRAIEGLDANPSKVDASLVTSDRRERVRATLGFTIPRTPIRLGVVAQRASRNGDVGDVHAKRSEQSLWGSAGVVF